MKRNFTDRVLGGVCGGLAAGLRINAWWLRILWVIFTVLTVGMAAVLYVALWWLLPQESLITEDGGSGLRFLLVLAVIVVIVGAWLSTLYDWIETPTGMPIFWPVALVVLAVIFLMRQMRTQS